MNGELRCTEPSGQAFWAVRVVQLRPRLFVAMVAATCLVCACGVSLANGTEPPSRHLQQLRKGKSSRSIIGGCCHRRSLSSHRSFEDCSAAHEAAVEDAGAEAQLCPRSVIGEPPVRALPTTAGADAAVAAVAAASSAGVAAPGFDPHSNVCLLTIMTQERMASLHRMLYQWDGYVSIALLVDSYADAAPQGIELLRYHGRLPPAPQRITLSIVEDRNYRSPFNRFPYNVLRNVALDGCTAEFVMAADVDFVPYPANPSAILRKNLRELKVGAPGSSNVLVLAAFEEVERSVNGSLISASAAAAAVAGAAHPGYAGGGGQPPHGRFSVQIWKTVSVARFLS